VEDKKKLRIPFQPFHSREKRSELCNFVPKHSAEEKKAQNSIPNYLAEEKTSEFCFEPLSKKNLLETHFEPHKQKHLNDF
jgi:hypothetical protein